MVCGNVDGWGWFGVSKGHRIEASLREGVTAGNAAEGQPGAPHEAEADEGNVSVFGAGGEIEALSRAEGVENRRDDGLVKTVGDTDGERGLGVSHLLHSDTGDFSRCSFSEAF
jgi:hypothetical protein